MTNTFYKYKGIDEYRSDETALNYSYLKAFSSDPMFANAKSESKSLSLGDIIDMLLTQDESDILKKYYIYKENESLSDTVYKIIKDVFFNIPDDDKPWAELKNYQSLLKKYIVENNYYSNRKIETNVKNILETQGVKNLFNSLKNGFGKIPISYGLYQKALQCVKSLKENVYTNRFTRFDLNNVTVEHQFGFSIYLEQYKTYVKVLIDRLEIDHTVKTITPIDFKSTGKPILTFSKELFKYRYDIQAKLYKEAVKEYCNLFYKDYRVTDFIFVVVSTTDYRCLPFSTNNLLLKIDSHLTTNRFTINNVEYKSLSCMINEVLNSKTETHYTYGYDYGQQLELNNIIEL
jgi:hypothetical protein